MPRMNQMLDTLTPITEKRFMHHYNMPPWANGETGRVGSPKRREIGHGALAGRAILPVDAQPGGLRLHAAPRERGAGLERLDLDGVGVRLEPRR